MRAADRGDQARRSASARQRIGAALLRGARRRSGRQAQALGRPASAPRQSMPQRRRRHDAEHRAPAAHDRDIDGELVAAGDEFAGAVERIDQDERVREVARAARWPAASSDTTGTPGSTRARPSRITASAAWSAAVTGDWSALVRVSSEPARTCEDRRGGGRDDGRELVQERPVRHCYLPLRSSGPLRAFLPAALPALADRAAAVYHTGAATPWS